MITNEVMPPSHKTINHNHCLSFGRELIQMLADLIHWFMASFTSKDIITITSIP
jgi:hypothetical protein